MVFAFMDARIISMVHLAIAFAAPTVRFYRAIRQKESVMLKVDIVFIFVISDGMVNSAMKHATRTVLDPCATQRMERVHLDASRVSQGKIVIKVNVYVYSSMIIYANKTKRTHEI